MNIREKGKKTVLFFFFFIISSANILAADHLNVTSGSIDVIFQSGKTARVEFSYDGLLIENKTFDEYAKGREGGYRHIFKKEIKAAEKAFKDKWAKKIPHGLKLVDDSNADYIIKINIEELDLGSNAAGFWGMRTADGGALMWEALSVKDSAGKEVLGIEIDGLRGLGNNGVIFYKEGNRLKKVYEKLVIKLSEKD